MTQKETLKQYFDKLVEINGLEKAKRIIMETLLRRDSGFQLSEVSVSFDFRDSNGEPFIITEKLGPDSKIDLVDLLHQFMGTKADNP